MRGRRKDHSGSLAHHIHSRGPLPTNKGDKKGAGHNVGGSTTTGKAGVGSTSDDIKQPERKVRLEDDPTLMQLDDLITHIDSLQEPHKNQQLRFECLLMIYLLCHMCIQNYNIYRLVSVNTLLCSNCCACNCDFITHLHTRTSITTTATC